LRHLDRWSVIECTGSDQVDDRAAVGGLVQGATRPPPPRGGLHRRGHTLRPSAGRMRLPPTRHPAG